MSWKYFKQAVNVGCYTLSGFSLYYLISNEKLKIVHNSWTKEFKPLSKKWDSNWDHREPPNVSPEQQNEYNEKLDKNRAKAIRHIILIRHGQYNHRGTLTDKERVLTELGREQAKLTGQRLKELKIPINEFVMSTMTRAQETGNIILNELDDKSLDIQKCSLIEEGAPIPPEPKVGHWKPQNWFFVDGSRIEAGFRKHFHRADPNQKEDSYTVLVCHANVIRYYVCRALQVPPEAWLRMSLHHASITWLTIYPMNGRVTLKLFGDCGHIPKKSLSTK